MREKGGKRLCITGDAGVGLSRNFYTSELVNRVGLGQPWYLSISTN